MASVAVALQFPNRLKGGFGSDTGIRTPIPALRGPCPNP